MKNPSALTRIFDLKHYAVNDGPGIRTTVFFKGCPLHCAWCHNPESQSPQPELMLHPTRCINCGACLEVCPHGAISPGQPINRQLCTICGVCAGVCYSGAREVVGHDISLNELWAQIERDIPFHRQSGGGVTFSGGESLVQSDCVQALAEKCREQGVHTALDTCGYANWQVIEDLLPYIDLFLYDLKLMDDDRHQKYTGVSNRLVLQNLKDLSSSGSAIQIRMPLIAGINDDEDNIQQSVDFLANLPHIDSITLMPYHAIGRGKYEALGRSNPLPDAQPPDEIIIKHICDQFQHAGIPTRVLG